MGREALHRLRTALTPRVILAIGFALFLVYAFPGYMSNDSVQQLVEARNGLRSQAHPPIMAAEWAVLDAILSGPLLMLLLQGTLFLGGLYGLLGRVMPARAAAITSCAVLLFPPVLTTMAVIWKDSQMAAFILAGAALLVSDRRWQRLVGLALISAGCAFRYNAFGATVPIIGLLFEWRPGLRWWKRYAISGATAVLSVAVALGADRALTVQTQYLSPAFVDIVGVLTYTDTRSDEDLLHVLRGTPLRVTTWIQAHARSVYSARNPYGIDHGPGRIFDAPSTDEQRAELTRAWKEIVTSDWNAYFQSRVAGFLELIGWTDAPAWSAVWCDFVGGADQVAWVEHDATRSHVQTTLMLWFSVLSETPLFRPYLYIAVGLLLLVLCCRDRLTLALLASGLVYELSYLPAAGTPDFRYSHWLIVCVTTAAVMMFAQRYRRRRT